MHIQNALIDKAVITSADHGLLSAWIYLDYGGSYQGFGGYTLYLPKDFSHHSLSTGYAGHFIFRSMQVAGVSKWSDMAGKSVRVRLTKEGLGGRILAIGHIINDDWFCPDDDFKTQQDAEFAASLKA